MINWSIKKDGEDNPTWLTLDGLDYRIAKRNGSDNFSVNYKVGGSKYRSESKTETGLRNDIENKIGVSSEVAPYQVRGAHHGEVTKREEYSSGQYSVVPASREEKLNDYAKGVNNGLGYDFFKTY